MWQMGTLIGAPVGIGLAAGVVLPAMMIGIPIYVGRRVCFFSFSFVALRISFTEQVSCNVM